MFNVPDNICNPDKPLASKLLLVLLAPLSRLIKAFNYVIEQNMNIQFVIT